MNLPPTNLPPTGLPGVGLSGSIQPSAEIAVPSGLTRFVNWWRVRGQRLADPETVAATIIVVTLALSASVFGGIIVVAIVLIVALAVHMAAVESGHYLMLWVCTAMLLVLVLTSAIAIFGGLPAILWALGGSIALVHNELVRINFARRRDAIIDESVFSSSVIGVGAATLVGITGSGIASIISTESERSWLWLGTAFAVLTFIGLAMVIIPVRNTTARDKEPFRPGERIPPQPLAKETITGT